MFETYTNITILINPAFCSRANRMQLSEASLDDLTLSLSVIDPIHWKLRDDHVSRPSYSAVLVLDQRSDTSRKWKQMVEVCLWRRLLTFQLSTYLRSCSIHKQSRSTRTDRLKSYPLLIVSINPTHASVYNHVRTFSLSRSSRRTSSQRIFLLSSSSIWCPNLQTSRDQRENLIKWSSDSRLKFWALWASPDIHPQIQMAFSTRVCCVRYRRVLLGH